MKRIITLIVGIFALWNVCLPSSRPYNTEFPFGENLVENLFQKDVRVSNGYLVSKDNRIGLVYHRLDYNGYEDTLSTVLNGEKKEYYSRRDTANIDIAKVVFEFEFKLYDFLESDLFYSKLFSSVSIEGAQINYAGFDYCDRWGNYITSIPKDEMCDMKKYIQGDSICHFQLRLENGGPDTAWFSADLRIYMGDTIFIGNKLSSNDTMMGVVLFEKTVYKGEDFYVNAQPNKGYYFKQWSDGNTSQTRFFSENNIKDHITAIFEKYRGRVSLLSDHGEVYRNVKNDGWYKDSIVLTAEPFFPYECKKFSHWSDGDTTNPRVWKKEGIDTLIAYFEDNNPNVIVESSDENMGTIEVFDWCNGNFVYDSSKCALMYDSLWMRAINKSGYHLALLEQTKGPHIEFSTYKENGVCVFRANSFKDSLSCGETLHYIAHFEKDKDTFCVTVRSSDLSMGTARGGGCEPIGYKINKIATPKDGYIFDYWESSHGYSIDTVYGHDTLIAHFKRFNVHSNNSRLGYVLREDGIDSTIYGDLYGDSIRLRAVSLKCAYFSHWSDGVIDNPRVWKNENSDSLIAYFEEPPSVKLSFKSANETMGIVVAYGYDIITDDIVNISSPYMVNWSRDTMIVLTVQESNGYRFSHWNNGSKNKSIYISGCDSMEYVAYFEMSDTFCVTVLSENEYMGTVNGGGCGPIGHTINKTIIPNDCYEFDFWESVNGYSIDSIEGYDTLIAHFVEKKKYLLFTSNDESMGSVSGRKFRGKYYGDYYNLCDSVLNINRIERYSCGDTIDIIAEPKTGYHFSYWSNGLAWSEISTSSGDFETYVRNNVDFGDTLVMVAYFEKDSIINEKNLSINHFDGLTYVLDNNQCYVQKKWDSTLSDVTIPKTIEYEGVVYDVTRVSSCAFKNDQEITSLTILADSIIIGDSAFYQCTNIKSILCFSSNPPQCSLNSFMYNGLLYVPCNYTELYRTHKYWGNYESIECPRANETIVEESKADPTSNEVSISWPKIDNATSYTLIVKENDVVICTLNFDADGQLEDAEYSPSTTLRPVSKLRLGSLKALSSMGYEFVVKGLNENMKYDFVVMALNSQNTIIESYEGDFVTKKSQEMTLQENTQINRVFFSDNHVYFEDVKNSWIRIFNMQGQCVYESYGICDVRLENHALYVLCVGNETYKLLTK